MSERLLPEAIRGSWYLLPEDGTPQEALEAKGQLLGLHLDGTFVRYEVDRRKKEEKERGDYTFDGDFLILRGRNTDTFRVHIESEWCWFLEAKKKNRRLFRGLIEADDFLELSEEAKKEIRMLPMRVKVRCPYGDESDAVYDLVFEPKEGDEQRIGCMSVDPDLETGALWVGLTPVATNLEAEVWEKVIRKSFLDIHKNNEGELGWVSLEVLDGDHPVREFDTRA